MPCNTLSHAWTHYNCSWNTALFCLKFVQYLLWHVVCTPRLWWTRRSIHVLWSALLPLGTCPLWLSSMVYTIGSYCFSDKLEFYGGNDQVTLPALAWTMQPASGSSHHCGHAYSTCPHQHIASVHKKHAETQVHNSDKLPKMQLPPQGQIIETFVDMSMPCGVHNSITAHQFFLPLLTSATHLKVTWSTTLTD